MTEILDLLGVGVGPFNLSLAALLEKAPQFQSFFLERKPCFEWYPELMFPDSVMQTSFLKDLVTPVDPKSSYSFLNYLSERQLFYAFLNTQRTAVTRREFELYCCWVSEKLIHKLKFGSEVRGISFDQNQFKIQTDRETYWSKNVCVATGLSPRIPDCAQPLLGPQVFHAKSPWLKEMNLEQKSVLIIGGGQTGIEVFRNALFEKWGKPSEVTLVTRRPSLEPLDDSAFTNEYFTPNYVDTFWDLNLEKKGRVLASQKLASDGNTPSYLLQLYQDLYRLKYVENHSMMIRILACRKLSQLQRLGSQLKVILENTFSEKREERVADVVVLCTGFQSVVPKFLEPLFSRIPLDSEGRFTFRKSYAIEWDGPPENRIYALNFSRHNHGIMDPQTSLMAWRSAVVVNDLTQEPIYETRSSLKNFVEYL